MSKHRYHIERSDEGWEVVDGKGLPANDFPFRTRREAVHFKLARDRDNPDYRLDNRFWQRVEALERKHVNA